MQMLVQSWLLYRLTGEARWLGLTAFASQVPAFLLSPLAGVIGDRADRRKLLMWADAVQMIQAFTLAALVFFRVIAPWQIVALAVILGLSTAFDITTRHAFAGDLVGKEHLTSAVSLNAISINGARVLGPALGGLLLPKIGEAGCFLINGLSYAWFIYQLAKMKLSTSETRTKQTVSILHSFLEALRYTIRKTAIRRLLIIGMFGAFIGFPYMILLPVFAKDVLHGGAQTLGWLSSAGGIGGIIGVFTIGSRYNSEKVESQVLLELALTGASFVLLGFSRSVAFSLLGCFFAGFFMMSIFPKMNVAIQALVDDEMRARVLSFYTMTFLGFAPIGSLVGGYLADHWPAAEVTVGAGIACMVFTLAWSSWPRLRCIRTVPSLKMNS